MENIYLKLEDILSVEIKRNTLKSLWWCVNITFQECSSLRTLQRLADLFIFDQKPLKNIILY